MRILHRSRRPARLAGCAALALGLAGTAVTGPPAAQARVTWPVINQHAAASWGQNNEGQLGDGSPADRALYGGVSGLAGGVVQVAAGSEHGLAVTSGGTVWAWGRNVEGELGDGTLTTSRTPVRVMGLTGIIAVSAGGRHSLALRSDGTVWAWGDNEHGQMGNGVTSLHQLTPVEVAGLAGVTKISAGGDFSLALRSDGTVWAWGYNQDGELGNGTTADSSVPVRVTGLSQVTSIAAGGEASVAVRTTGIAAATSVWAWGGNHDGELGDGTLTGHSTPEQVTGINVPGIAGISMSAFSYFVVALGTDGSVWGWGSDEGGQLGSTPTFTAVTRPVRVIGPAIGITQVSAGRDHVLALESSGTVLAWGDNFDGELGNGRTTLPIVAPVQVTGLTTASQVSAGNNFSLAVYQPPSVAGP